LAASRRIGHKRPGPSFETPRKCAAPQDEGWRFSFHVFGSAKFLPGRFGTIASRRNLRNPSALFVQSKIKEADMGFGKGALLWLIGIPLPIILLLALFMNR
jgi:hypothetical protein